MKVNNREKIRMIVEADPAITDSEIARLMGVSRQRIHQYTKTMDLNREPMYGKCSACSKRISIKKQGGWCSQCRKDSFGYEFVCFQCGKLVVAKGWDASSRRRLRKKNPDRPDFCGRKCANKSNAVKHWAVIKLREQALDTL